MIGAGLGIGLLAQAARTAKATSESSSGSLLDNWLVYAFVMAAAFFAIAFLAYCAFKALYKRTGANLAFVRTGQGKARVVVDGGAFVIGFLHQIKWINLETMRLQVHREGKDALITKDKFRVDISVEFYIRVEPTDEQILRAARTLGDRSLTPENVKQLIEAKLIGALRSVAATKPMIDLHQDRQTFEDEVQEALKRDLEKNGLNLESVAIVHLDQTDKTALDPNNVFDAEGLKLITDATERARKEKNEIQRNAERQIKDKDVETDIAIKAKVAENLRRANEIQQETDVQVKRQTVEAEKKKLTAEQELEQAASTQLRTVETFKAEQVGETQRYKYEQEQAVRTREIEKERAVKQAEIERDLRIKEAELARETTLVAKRREMQEATIAAELTVERAKRDKDIGIIEKVREQEAAEAEKLATVAERERAEQNVLTVQSTLEAERDRQVAVLKQRALAEQAQVEKQVAADAQAYEIRKKAEAEALAAEQQAAAIERIALARLKEAEARAEGERKMVEARNLISPQILLQDGALKLIDQTPAIVRELMKPAEKISDIRILNVSGAGLNGGGGAGTNGTGAGGEGSIVGKVVSSLLEAGAAYPMFKELLKFANVDLEKATPRELATRAVDAMRTAAAGGAGSGSSPAGMGGQGAQAEPPAAAEVVTAGEVPPKPTVTKPKHRG